MEKKNLKMYEAPAVETVEVEAQSVICASDNTNADGWGVEDGEFE